MGGTICALGGNKYPTTRPCNNTHTQYASSRKKRDTTFALHPPRNLDNGDKVYLPDKDLPRSTGVGNAPTNDHKLQNSLCNCHPIVAAPNDYPNVSPQGCQPCIQVKNVGNGGGLNINTGNFTTLLSTGAEIPFPRDRGGQRALL